jgi:glycine oxidase
LSAVLREQTGIDNGYLRCGGLEICETAEDLMRRQRKARRWSGQDDVLEGEALRRLEPALAETLAGAIHHAAVAQVRSPRHLKALTAACTRLGVQLRPDYPAYAVDTRGSRVTGVRCADRTLSADRYLIAAGAWSGSLLRTAPIRPIRGQIVLLRPDRPSLGRVVLAGPRYLVPRPDGRVLVGSTEEDAGFVKETTAAGIGDLLAFAVGLVPRLAQAEVERCWAGLRPGSPDGKPYLGAVPGFDNLFVAAGHFRSGVQLSPITGLVMRDLLLGRPSPVPLGELRPDRKG